MQTLALYAAFLAVAAFNEVLARVPGGTISLWLPAGILVAALLTTSTERWLLWIGVAASSELTGNLLWYGHAPGPAAMLVAGNVAAAIVGAVLARRIVKRRMRLNSVREVVVFVIAAGVIMPLISASLASVALGWSYGTPPFRAWPRVFLGDAAGALIAGPLVLRLMTIPARVPRPSASRVVEALALAVAFLAVGAIALGGAAPFAYLAIPPLVWAALRFRVWGAVAATITLTAMTAGFTIAGTSPFAGPAYAAPYGGVGLQLFLLVAALSALLVAAIAEEHARALNALETRVHERTARLARTTAEADRTTAILKAISDASPDLIFAKDREGRMAYANAATLAVMGLPLARVIGQDSYAVTPDPAQAAAIEANDLRIMERGETEIVDEEFTSPGRSPRIFRSTKTPLRDPTGTVIGLAGVTVDVTDMKAAEARERLLAQEIDHRAKNLLTVVQSIVQLTRAETLPAFRAAVTGRIQAFARTHSLLAQARWDGAELMLMLTDELAPHGIGERVTLDGPPAFLSPAAAQGLALVVHELTTNAAKYGALSSGNGKLDVVWSVDGSTGVRTLNLVWREHGGEGVKTPSRRGFGTRVIEATVEQQLGGSIAYEWAGTGLTVTLRLAIDPAG